MSLNNRQQSYVDISIKTQGVRDCISSGKEFDFIEDVLSKVGLKEDVDYKHQFCFHDDEVVIVVDFLLVEPKIVIELDGISHKKRAQRLWDAKRDKLIQANGCIPIRIKTPMTSETVRFWRNFIRECYTVDNQDA